MHDFFEENRQILSNAILILLSILFSYVFFNYIFELISPFVIGWVLSLIYEPFVRFAQSKFKLSRKIGAMLSIILLIGFFSSVVAGVVSKIIDESKLFLAELPSYISEISASFSALTEKLDSVLLILPDDIRGGLDFSASSLADMLTPIIKSSGSGGVNAVKAIPNFFMIVILSLISSYFFSLDKEKVSGFVRSFMPARAVKTWGLIKENTLGALAGYFRTQLILMAFTSVICIIGFIVLKSPYALLLALVTSAIDALPFFGSGFILWPAAAISFINGNTAYAVGYIIIYLLVQLVRQIMQPKILGTQIGLHPLLTLLSIYLGVKFIGVLGMIIGPVIAVIIKVLYTATSSLPPANAK